MRACAAWYWYCMLAPWVYRSLAIVAAIFSVLLLWSECTFSVTSPTLSVFSLLIEAAGERTFGVMVRSLRLCLSVCLSVCLSEHLSVYLCVCRSV
jgi:hypothetical protein